MISWYRGLPNLRVALAGHNNSLGLIRLVLAIAVIFDHAFPLGGYGDDPVLALTKGQATLGDLAVIGFFGISGYLITKSGMSSDIVQFLWRRFLRIFPAYWLLLAVSALLVGPLFWMMAGSPLASYFSFDSTGPIGYIAKNWTLNIGTYGIYDIFQYTTPWGQFSGSSVFNGSIWTLIYEWNCYLLIALLVALGILKKLPSVVLLLAVLFSYFMYLNIANPGAMPTFYPRLGDQYFVRLTFAFLVGAALAYLANVVRAHLVFGVLAIAVIGVTLRTGVFYLFGVIAFTYLLLWLGSWLPKSWNWIGAKNDYSYGIYIYGFLVQQMLAFWGVNEWGYIPYVAITIPITFILAWLSWHALEKRAMSLKDWGPGRGISHWWKRFSKSATS